VKLQIFY